MSVLTAPFELVSSTKIISTARFCVLIGLTSIMLCVPFLNKLYTFAAILFVLSGEGSRAWPILIKNKVVIFALVLILLFAIGIFYTQGSLHFALRHWNKYLKLAYPLFFIPLFCDKKLRNYAIVAFLLSVMVSEAFAYLHYFRIISMGLGPGKHWLFVQDLDGGYVVSFAAFLLANLAMDNKKYRWLSLLCCLICSFDILFLNQERAGYLVFLALTGLFLWQRLSWRGVLAAMIALPIMFGGLFAFSPTFHNRIHQVSSNINQYQQGHEQTSIGLRLAFAKYSYSVIKEHWLLGAGTGSFEELYRKSNGPKLDDNTWPAHPHNEYLLIWFQIGTLGLMAFLIWLSLIWRATLSLPTIEKRLLQGVLVGFCLLGCCNAALLVNPAGALFVTFLSVFLATNYQSSDLLKGEVCV